MTPARADDPGPRAGDRGTDSGAGAGGSVRVVGPGIRGLLLAAAVCGVALLLPVPRRYDLLAALLALAGGVYVGFASEAPAGERRLQWAVALVTTGVGLVGAWRWPPLLAGAWIAHAGWDLWHHRAERPVRVRAGYPLFCLVFDVAVAAFVLATWIPTG